MKNRKEKIEEMAEKLKNFFVLFDGVFLNDEDAEMILAECREALKEKISRNESALVIIAALGGDYNRSIDEAKVEELDAFIRILKARKKLREATLREHSRKCNNTELLAEMFGI